MSGHFVLTPDSKAAVQALQEPATGPVLQFAEVTGIVLAGGRSRRFGKDKAFELIGRESLVQSAVHRLRGLRETILVTNELLAQQMDAVRMDARVISDLQNGQGPLGGIHAGLLAATGHHSLVVACDMPFLNCGLLQYLLNLRTGFDVVIPRLSGKLEPLHAVYSKDCLPAIERHLQEGRLVAYCFLDCVRVRFVEQDEVERFDPWHLSFFNVNSPADMKKARELAGQFAPDLVVEAEESPGDKQEMTEQETVTVEEALDKVLAQ